MYSRRSIIYRHPTASLPIYSARSVLAKTNDLRMGSQDAIPFLGPLMAGKIFGIQDF